jgi:hypothetical protein
MNNRTLKEELLMKRLLVLATLFLIAVVVGCSGNDNPTGPTNNPPSNTATSTWSDSGFWRSTVNASSYDQFMGFSFTTKDTTLSGLGKVTATGWDIAFRREAVKLNGGSSTDNSGDAEGADLGEVAFADITLADTVGVSWTEDAIEYFINDWYNYNPTTHQLSANGNVYSMVDAEGDNYVKFRIDSLVGAGMPPDMGTVHITYYYQPTADSRDLSGATSTAAIPVEMGAGYFDFSTGSVVSPSSAASSMDWDLAFSAYNVMQNSGPNGIGSCRAFYAYTELTSPNDIDAFTLQPSGAPMFEDIPSSALTDWYNYTGPPLHQLLSHGHVYLIRSEGKVYKLKIESYYANVSGVPTSGWYTFVWNEL